MSFKETYKKQQKLSFLQFIVDLPGFIAVLVSAIVSGSMIVWVDALDCLGYVLRSGMITLMSRKLYNDLRYEYNYGTGKIEAMVALLCDGIVFGGLVIMTVICFYELLYPVKPSDFLLPIVLLKIIHVVTDVIFYREQNKIVKAKGGAIAESSCQAYLNALLFDSLALVSILIAWIFRDNAVSWYFSPVASILLAGYLLHRCLKRFKRAIDELTDKTMPEEIQMKILKVLSGFYDRYSQMCSVKTRKTGDTVMIELVLEFEDNTPFSKVQVLRDDIQQELSKEIEKCMVNIIVAEAQD